MPAINDENLRDRCRGALLGLAAGDAVGTTVEFKPRGSFEPVTGMTGGGPFGLPAGHWTDDTSMALCLATSLLECGGFDARDQVERYCRWRDTGYLSSTGECFDIGITVSGALSRYRSSGDPYSGPTDPRSAGNGSIMRLAPVPIYYHFDPEAVAHYSAESSRTTHGAAECIDACRYLGIVIARGLGGAGREEMLRPCDLDQLSTPAVRRIAGGAWRGLDGAAIRGSGYVIDSLTAALWCFAHTESFEAAVLAAVNLGDDADTTAAVCGQVAGAYYGATGIPADWLDTLYRRDDIATLAEKLAVATH